MSKNNISNELIITTSARLSNEVGLNNLSLKIIAEELNIKSPSLYNHISSLDEIKEKLMIYGWKELGEKATESAVGVAGYEALRNMCYALTKVYLLQCFGITNLRVKKKTRLQQNYLVYCLEYYNH